MSLVKCVFFFLSLASGCVRVFACVCVRMCVRACAWVGVCVLKASGVSLSPPLLKSLM